MLARPGALFPSDWRVSQNNLVVQREVEAGWRRVARQAVTKRYVSRLIGLGLLARWAALIRAFAEVDRERFVLDDAQQYVGLASQLPHQTV
jgi:hypothetical protein